MSWLAYKRIATMIKIRAGQTTSRITVDGEELDAAMARYQADASPLH